MIVLNIKSILKKYSMTSLIGQDSVWRECVDKFDTSCHIFLTGAPGSGKTTLVRELLHKYAKDKGRPNASLWGTESNDECLLLGPDQDRGIQTIRGQVSMFIRQRSIGEELFRWVIIDDVDTFPQISQQALRRPMESYSHITRFIFIGTSEEDLIPALRSRSIHISMNAVDIHTHKNDFLNHVNMINTVDFTNDMWAWVLSIVSTNISNLIRLLKLIRDITETLHLPLTLSLVQMLCSAPFYTDFLPLLKAMSAKDHIKGTAALLNIWKRGYAYEDILESFQTINTMFGTNSLYDNIIIHKFLINAWIAYCKGNTSILALQNVLYKTIACH